MKITAIIPTFNEEIHIEEAIKSVSFADEIIIIDSYSTDNTVALIKRHKVTLIQRVFDDFSSQKNYAIGQATHDWIFVLDADERVTEFLREEILQTVLNKEESVAYWIYRSNIFMNREIKYSGWQNDKVIRLFNKEYCKYNGKLVHEEITAKGKVGFLKNKLEHYSYKNFDTVILKRNKYAQLQAESLYKKGVTPNLFHFLIKPAFRFFKHYIIQKGFLDGFQGFIISFMYCYTVLVRYIKLWLLIRKMK